MPQWLSNAIASLGQFVGGSPRALARFLSNALPGPLKSKFRERIADKTEDIIEPVSESLEDFFN